MGVGQYQGSDLLVCRFACHSLPLRYRGCGERELTFVGRRGRDVFFAYTVGCDRRLADGVGPDKVPLFNPDSVRIAEQIKTKTPANCFFLNAATYNTAIALTGRESLMSYPGHLSSLRHRLCEPRGGRKENVRGRSSSRPAARKIRY